MSSCYTAYNCTRRRKRNNSRRAHTEPRALAHRGRLALGSSRTPLHLLGTSTRPTTAAPSIRIRYSCAGSDCAIAAPARGGGPPGAALQAASAVAARGAAAAEKAAGGALVGGTLVGTLVGTGEAAAGVGLE